MWRRYGDIPYTLLVFAVFSLEVISLAFVTWTFSGDLFGFVPHMDVEGVLVAAVALTAAALAMLAGYVLVYHALSLSRERRSQERIKEWTDLWIQALFKQGPFPEPPLSPEAQEAALSLRELLGGEEGKEIASRLEEAGVGESLIRRVHSRRRTVRLEALEALARARLPATFGAVTALLRHPQPHIRLMAGRTAARTIAIWNGPSREIGVASFAQSLPETHLPAGALTEVLILLEDAAPAVINRLMADPSLPASIARACLDAIGRLELVQLAYEAGSRITHRDPEVRAAALRALGRLQRVPTRSRDAVVIALADDTEFVRIQAARAAAFVPEPSAVTALSHALGDRSWWVRRASAESLLARDEWGLRALQQAAASHRDRFARDMAAQVLRDAGHPVPRQATSVGSTS